MSTLFFYTKNQFFNFKSTQSANGIEFLSMSQLLSSQKIEKLDEEQQYYVDLSSVVGFVKDNDSQLLNFEQLFNSFEDNITFICDKTYEEDIKYIFRYVFDDFLDVETENEEIKDKIEETVDTKSSVVKKLFSTISVIIFNSA